MHSNIPTKLLRHLFLLTVVGCAAALCQKTPTAPPNRIPVVKASHVQEANDRYAKQMLERLNGREKEPAEKVFKNIRLPWFKTVPAETLIDIMNGGYSRALGVACTYCHVAEDFAMDDKREKRAAREMAVMHKMINEQLGKMLEVRGKLDERFINCSTCHRGAIDPTVRGQ